MCLGPPKSSGDAKEAFGTSHSSRRNSAFVQCEGIVDKQEQKRIAGSGDIDSIPTEELEAIVRGGMEEWARLKEAQSDDPERLN